MRGYVQTLNGTMDPSTNTENRIHTPMDRWMTLRSSSDGRLYRQEINSFFKCIKLSP